MDKFWESLGGKLAERWLTVSAQALVFWLGALLIWAWGHDGTHRLTDWLSRQKTPVQYLTVVIVLLGVAGSGAVVQQFAAPVLRILEGYWPKGFRWPRDLLIGKVQREAEKDAACWQTLAPRVLTPGAVPAAEDLNDFAAVDERLRRRPRTAAELMPTRTGNILRAAETWPADKYGLDALTVWPRLWLVMPELTRTEVMQARAALNRTVTTALWSLLFCLLTPWSWFALPLGLLTAAVTLRWTIPSRAEVYADLVEAAFDLHRTALYEHLRHPLPTDPANELITGRALTVYLRRGSDRATPTFPPPS